MCVFTFWYVTGFVIADSHHIPVEQTTGVAKRRPLVSPSGFLGYTAWYHFPQYGDTSRSGGIESTCRIGKRLNVKYFVSD